MFSATQALTVIAEIDPARRATLDARLRAIGDNVNRNAVFRPRDLPATHFMRFVIVDDAELPALLVWESNHDGNASDYLVDIATRCPAIDRVLECCRGYPGTSSPAWLRWMLDRSRRSAAFYCAYRGIPRAQVVNDGAVHDAMKVAADTDRAALDRMHPTQIQHWLGVAMRAAHPTLDTAPQDDDELRWAIGKVLAVLGAIVVLPLALLVVGPWLVALRYREKTDPSPTYHRPVHDDNRFALAEDRFTQNQLTHVVDIKPGWFRLFTVWAVLTVIDVLARVYFVDGQLGGINSIHFARWVIVRDRRPVARKRHRLLFFSNYDGSWESYLGEFIDRAASGLTAVWSNTVDFPPSRWLVRAGARDEEAFKQWTRDHQIATQVWWTGVPRSTVQNVRDDIWLRRRLHRPLADDEARAWLRKL
jgi:hypothetical protein